MFIFHRSIQVFAASLFLLTGGCLSSPLLDHADADQLGHQPQQRESAGCALRFPKNGLCASLTWTRPPTEEEAGALVLRFWNEAQGTESGPYVDPPLAVAVKLWMPSMGHGSSPVKVTQAKDPSGAAVTGIFEASQVYFVMPGDWEIWVQLKQEKQVIEQAKLDFFL